MRSDVDIEIMPWSRLFRRDQHLVGELARDEMTEISHHRNNNHSFLACWVRRVLTYFRIENSKITSYTWNQKRQYKNVKVAIDTSYEAIRW